MKYEWGIQVTYTEEWGGHTVINPRTSEEDARHIVRDHEDRKRRGKANRGVADIQLVRRPLGEWENV